jgi:uncharacterized protein (DUF58 family)
MKRILILGGLIYLLLLVGLASLDRRLLVLAIPLLIYLGAALPFGPGELRLRAERSTSPDRTIEGAPVNVRLSITNEGSALEQLLVQDLVPPRLAVEDGKPEEAIALGPGETFEMEYTLKSGRGYYDWEHVQVIAGDLLGLSQRTTLVAAPGHLTVLPRVVPLRRLAIRPLRTRGHAGPVPARRGGPGTDFYGVREYQLGDPQRWINWRASARHDAALFTNDFEQERIADVGLILDARIRNEVRAEYGVGARNESLFEHAVQATASLADTFLRDGNRVALLVFGRYVDWTFPGYGKVQREQILRALARAEPGESQIFDSLEFLPTRLFPAGSQIVMVSPVSRDDLPVLLRLRGRGYQLLVIRPDPIAFEMQGLAPEPSRELAARILRAERGLVRRRLQQAGVQVVEWPVDRLLDQMIHASLGRVPPWFRSVGVER